MIDWLRKRVLGQREGDSSNVIPGMEWREIDQILLHHSVILSSTKPSPARHMRIEAPFLIVPPNGPEHTIIPGEYEASVSSVVALLGTTVRYANIEVNQALHLGFSDGSYVRVEPDGPSPWEYGDDADNPSG